MKTDSPFNELQNSTRVRVWLDDSSLDLPKDMNLAAALLLVGVKNFRYTHVSGTPRAPFCMMGTCFECRVKVNGVTRLACMLKVEKGLRIYRAGSYREQK